jgi:hypothetical protein
VGIEHEGEKKVEEIQWPLVAYGHFSFLYKFIMREMMGRVPFSSDSNTAKCKIGWKGKRMESGRPTKSHFHNFELRHMDMDQSYCRT